MGEWKGEDEEGGARGEREGEGRGRGRRKRVGRRLLGDGISAKATTKSCINKKDTQSRARRSGETKFPVFLFFFFLFLKNWKRNGRREGRWREEKISVKISALSPEFQQMKKAERENKDNNNTRADETTINNMTTGKNNKKTTTTSYHSVPFGRKQE